MKDVVKQGVACPLSIEKINNFTQLCALFFIEALFDFHFLIALNDRNKNYLSIMESTQYFDKQFASKFCLALDMHFFHWMKQ